MCDKEFFENISNYQSSLDDYVIEVRTMLPQKWKIEKIGMWYYVSPEELDLPEQGFKIHISAHLLNAKKILRLVALECIKEKTSFKFAIDKNILSFLNSKNCYRGSAGKFITIYPPNLDVFMRIIENIYLNTKNMKGPYILSDRAYKDSEIVFYRYGGFKAKEILTIDGTKKPVLLSPEGDLIEDERLPYFKLPDWVVDPFGGSKEVKYKDSIILNKRYKVIEAIAFSNSGGVYKGIDLVTNQMIIIKEARPYTNFWSNRNIFLDSMKLLEKEFNLLKKLEDTSLVPKPIDIFKEWKHLFLVEEYVEGVPLSTFRASHEFLIAPFFNKFSKIKNFCTKFKIISTNLVKAISIIHNHNIILGDVSPNNILIDPKTLDVKFVDFEGAFDFDSSKIIKDFSSLWATPGFVSSQRILKRKVTYKDDYYSLGMVLYSLILPIQAFFDLDFSAINRFLKKWTENGLPEVIGEVITNLLKGKIKKVIAILNKWDVNAELPKKISIKKNHQQIRKELPQIIQKIKAYILNTITLNRQDRLCPSDYQVFQTNPLSIAYGASGIILFLDKNSNEVSQGIRNWLFSQKIDNSLYPPGLYIGLAGIAYTFSRLGYLAKGEEVMDLLFQSSLLYETPDMFYGASGWGLISLYFFVKTKNNKYLEKACQAGEYIIKCSKVSRKGRFWQNKMDNKIYLGFAFGGSGISLFLLYLYLFTREKIFLNSALEGIKFEISNALDSRDCLYWGRFVGDNLIEPYWLYGSAGIGSSLIRFFSILEENKYKFLAEKAAKSAFSKFTVVPSQFEGLAGIGEFMLDMFQITKNEYYLKKAYEIADSILLYKIEKPEGIAFPGSYLLRISNDYGTGSAGIGLFLNRLITLEKREFHDIL